MLVCPHCQYDNPNNHQSCSRCGTSLTHKACPECGSKVSFQAQTCPNCGTFTGSAWLAIIAEPIRTDMMGLTNGVVKRFDQVCASTFPLAPNIAVAMATEDYLDSSRRYRLISVDSHQPLEATVTATEQSIQRQIIDCQPLQKSVLKILLQQYTELIEDPKNYLGIEELKSPWLPKLAFPYVRLHEFYPAIPEIHDAWQEDNKEVIILSDRSQWQLLSDLWSTESLPILQIVYWLDEMAKLWKALSEVGYSQSLLVESNLRVDEDQIFGLQKLYPDPTDTQLTLKDLAQSWHNLIEQSLAFPAPSLMSVLEKVSHGDINTVTELRLQLQEIADEQQITASSYMADDLSLDEISSPDLNHFKSTAQGITCHHQAVDPLTTSPYEYALLDNSDEISTAVIPMQLLSLVDAGYTDNGRQRRHNEDCFGIDSQMRKQQSNRGQRMQARGLYLVCDGMGGHAAGEVASAMAVESLQRYFANCWHSELPSREVIQQGIFGANQAIFQVNQEKASHGSGRMGTTLVMALIQDTRLAIAHVGDSRIYRVTRKWGLEQLSIDHEVGQRAIQDGVDPKLAYVRPDAYQLTQALGPHDDCYVKPDIQFFEVSEDCLLLLCSDGLSDHQLIENHWQTHLNPSISSQCNLEEELHKLIALGNQKNGHDNITAILVRVKVQPDVEQSIWL